jgi:hypothetical protein
MAHPELAASHFLHEMDVGAEGKGFMVLDFKADFLERHAFDIVHENHYVRVAHRNRCDVKSFAVDIKGMIDGLAIAAVTVAIAVVDGHGICERSKRGAPISTRT